MPAWAIIEKDGYLLFLQRSPHTTRPGQWCLPGGGIKTGESPAAACLREVKEETDLDVDMMSTLPPINGHYYFRCTLSFEEQAVILQTREAQTYRWVQPQDLHKLGFIMDYKQVIPLLEQFGYTVD